MDEYKNDADTKSIFRCLLSLPLLLTQDIIPVFAEVKTLLSDQARSQAAMGQLFRYVERQRLQGDHRPSASVCRDNASRTRKLSCRSPTTD